MVTPDVIVGGEYPTDEDRYVALCIVCEHNLAWLPPDAFHDVLAGAAVICSRCMPHPSELWDLAYTIHLRCLARCN